MENMFGPYKEKNSFLQIEGSVPMSNRGLTSVLQDKITISDESINIVKDKIDLSKSKINNIKNNP